MSNEVPIYFLYILLCDNSVLYTGIALDPKARLKQHQTGRPYGAKFTRKFSQLELVYQVQVGSRSNAQKIEYHIKKCPRKDKLRLIKAQPNLEQLSNLLSLNIPN